MSDRPYETGYGKPPKSRQFMKGKSGNPKGQLVPRPLLLRIDGM